MESSSYAPIPRGEDEDRNSPKINIKVRPRRHSIKGVVPSTSAITIIFSIVVVGSFFALFLRNWKPETVTVWAVDDGVDYGILNRTSVPIWPVPTPLAPGDEDYVAICVSIRGQAYDLPEWLRHHYYHLNIRTFYIMDDGTVPPLADQFTDTELGIPRSSVHFIRYLAKDRILPQQFNAYQDCVAMFGRRHVWFALIDADEFIEMVEPGLTLPALLRTFESTAGALAVNWIVHDSNGLDKKPTRGACRQSYTSCMVDPRADGSPIDNAHVKLIAQSEYFRGMITPHDAHYSEGRIAVGEDGVPIGPPGYLRNPPVRNKIALHHYVVKSKEEYQEKVDRGNGMDDPKAWDFWEYVENSPKMACRSLGHYTP